MALTNNFLDLFAFHLCFFFWTEVVFKWHMFLIDWVLLHKGIGRKIFRGARFPSTADAHALGMELSKLH